MTRSTITNRSRKCALVSCAIALVARVASAGPGDAFATDDPAALEAEIAQLEHASAGTDPDALLSAARACEDKLAAPARALALYDRILHDAPDARAALTARRRATVLRRELGEHREFASQATALAHLIGDAGHLAEPEVLRRVDELAAQRWPGAPEAELFAAEWLRTRGELVAAQDRYQLVRTKWPGSPQAVDATRAGAGCAIDARDWELAENLAREIPAGDPLEVAARAELLGMVARDRTHARIYALAWAVLGVVLLALVASLVEASARGGWRRPRVRPPVEVLFLGPLAAAVMAIALFSQRAIAPAVTRISLVGLALAYVSGTTLDLLQRRRRAYRARSLAHAVVCVVGVIAIAYIAVTRDGLLEVVATTLRDGPQN